MATPHNEIMTILAWNPVWRAGVVKADTEALMPSFLFKPSLEMVDLMQQNRLSVIEIDIAGTNSLYDGIQKAVIDRSNLYGGDRPNYFATKGLYIATLVNRDWFSYPPVNGVFKVRTGVLSSYEQSAVPEERQVRIVDPSVKEGFEMPLILSTKPSIGAVANAAYEATVEQAHQYEPFRCDRCHGAPVGPSDPSYVAFDQDATVERFEMKSSFDPADASPLGGMSFFFAFFVFALFFLYLRSTDSSSSAGRSRR